MRHAVWVGDCLAAGRLGSTLKDPLLCTGRTTPALRPPWDDEGLALNRVLKTPARVPRQKIGTRQMHRSFQM